MLDRFDKILRLVNLINLRMKAGCMTIDKDNDAILFKCANIYPEGINELSVDLQIDLCLQYIDKFIPAFQLLIHSDLSEFQVLDIIENDTGEA